MGKCCNEHHEEKCKNNHEPRKVIIYSGPNLPCTGINTCDDDETFIKKINTKICELIQTIHDLTSTTTTTISPTTTSTTTAIPQSLILTFDDIANADLMIGGSSSDVSLWNTFFDLPTYGNPFTSVSVVGNEVNLIGSLSLVIKNDLFDAIVYGENVISIIDTLGCITSVGFNGCGYKTNNGLKNCTYLSLPNVVDADDWAFSGIGLGIIGNVILNLPNLVTAGESCFSAIQTMLNCSLPSLVSAGNYCFNSNDHCITIDLPLLQTAGNNAFFSNLLVERFDFPFLASIGDYGFGGCLALNYLNLSSCTTLGTSVLDNFVFQAIWNNIITLTIPSALMTCNTGNPDGDIVYLQTYNTVIIITV